MSDPTDVSVVGDVFDANANVGPAIYPDEEFEFEPTLEALERQFEAAGIDGAVVAPLKPPGYDFDAANEALADRLDGHQSFYGIARVDPRVEDAADQAASALDEYGLGGLKLHPWEETFHVDAAYVEPVLEVAARHDAPVWIHTGYYAVSHALSVLAVAESFPEVPMVITHGGHLNISGLSLPDAEILAAETENTYFEMSAVYRHDYIQDTVEAIGAERVMFGSNAPYFHPTVELSRIADAYLDDEAKAMAMGGAIKQLLGIE